MIGDYFSLSFKNLKHRGIRSWLTLLGIFIGIAAVISLITLGSGLKMAVVSQFGVSSTEIITVQAGGLTAYGPPGSGVTNPLTTEDADAIKKLGTVKRVLPRSIQTARIEFNDKLLIGYATNIPEGDDAEFMYEINDLEIDKGRLLKDSDNGKVVVGSNFLDANKNGFEKAIKVGDKILIKDERFEVAGILKKKGSFIWDGIVLINEKEMTSLFDLGNTVDIIAVQVKSKDLIDKTKIDIEKLMRKRRDVKEGEEDFTVQTPEAALATINTILGGIQAFIIIIASISILVGAIGIVNTMTTSVLERRREIGIMKAIGAKNEHVFFQFLVESGLMGFIGGLIGVLFGMLIGYLGILGINSFIGSEASLDVNFFLIGFTLLGSFLIGAGAGIAPAMQAAKQSPVEALRG